jgi:hypothetical protein
MLDREHLESLRRIVFRAFIFCAPLIALAIAAPRAVSWWKHRGDAPPTADVDRPPTDEEFAAARDAEQKLARAEKPFGADAIVPSGAVPDAAGEKVRWFQGFGVSVESKPGGAQVLVNGEDKGTTPLVTGVKCTVGERVSVEVRKPGRRPQHRSTVCRQDKLVELDVRLD